MTDLSNDSGQTAAFDPRTYEVRPDSRAQYYVIAGFIFLVGALALFAVAAYAIDRTFGVTPAIPPGATADVLATALLASATALYLPPILLMIGALICALFGSRLLRAGGVATTQVISPQDRLILGPAVASANADAITQWIRLNSLTGAVGFFTKIGLTGLPLATLALTIILALLGLKNNNLLEMAKLTLGAFLGSFVQRQADPGLRQGLGMSSGTGDGSKPGGKSKEPADPPPPNSSSTGDGKAPKS